MGTGIDCFSPLGACIVSSNTVKASSEANTAQPCLTGKRNNLCCLRVLLNSPDQEITPGNQREITQCLKGAISSVENHMAFLTPLNRAQLYK